MKRKSIGTEKNLLTKERKVLSLNGSLNNRQRRKIDKHIDQLDHKGWNATEKVQDHLEHISSDLEELMLLGTSISDTYVTEKIFAGYLLQADGTQRKVVSNILTD